MSVPDFQSIFLPVLRATSDGQDHSMADIRERVSSELTLSAEDLSVRLPSGKQTTFANRVAWSAVYLHRAGALDRTLRGVFRITDRGRELTGLKCAQAHDQNLNQYPEFKSFHKGTPKDTGSSEEPKLVSARTETPEEQLADAYKILRDSLANDLLETVSKSSPDFLKPSSWLYW